MMTKKDFVALADELKGLKIPPVVLTALCRFCHSRNNRFKKILWLDYLAGECGPGGGGIKKGKTK